MKKKLLIFICFCWIVVFGLIFFSPALGNTLIALGFGESAMLVFQWIFGLAVLLGAGIPFAYLSVSLSNWYEKIIEDSTIYGKDDD